MSRDKQPAPLLNGRICPEAAATNTYTRRAA